MFCSFYCFRLMVVQMYFRSYSTPGFHLRSFLLGISIIALLPLTGYTKKNQKGIELESNKEKQADMLQTCVASQNTTYLTSKHCRNYHRCTYLKIPYISPPLETAQYLLHSNKSFIRYGDSEVLLARGKAETFQYADRELAQRLTSIFRSRSDMIVFGIYDTFTNYPMYTHKFTNWWIDYQGHYREWVLENGNLDAQYFSAMISSTYVHTYGTFCALLPLIYRTLREIWNDKDIVILRGDNKQQYQYDIYNNARSQKIILAPRYHAWSAYSELKSKLLEEDSKKLFILTSGPVARVLTFDLAMKGRRALDLGHLAKDYDEYKKGQPPIPYHFFERDEDVPPHK